MITPLAILSTCFLQITLCFFSVLQPKETVKHESTYFNPQEACQLVVPASLTINSENKYWTISCACKIEEFKIEIYDRWGKKMYSSTTLEDSKYILWDFWNFKKETYYWTINYSAYKNGELVKLNQTGHVTIL